MPRTVARLLIVKTSSLGDVVHTLPVVSDIAEALPACRIDWLVERSYADLLRMHPALHRVIAVDERRWRAASREEARSGRQAFALELKQESYDLVLDLQGLLKSAWLARHARLQPGGALEGLAFGSVREPLARLFYRRAYAIDPQAHAVERLRSLAAQALGYRVEGAPRFALEVPVTQFPWLPQRRYAVFLHASARAEKRWSAADFRALATGLAPGYTVVLPHGNAQEERDARAIASNLPALVAPRMSLSAMAGLLKGASLVVGVDTGLTHLSAALGTPTVGLFGATPRWRYAPYWGPHIISLGDERQPQLSEVVAAIRKLRAEFQHA